MVIQGFRLIVIVLQRGPRGISGRALSENMKTLQIFCHTVCETAAVTDRNQTCRVSNRDNSRSDGMT